MRRSRLPRPRRPSADTLATTAVVAFGLIVAALMWAFGDWGVWR
jgi:hypothetical protein